MLIICKIILNCMKSLIRYFCSSVLCDFCVQMNADISRDLYEVAT